ncbi:hypothetical protein RclHR1_03740003 [Rhizophagus clarus]|uniref:Glycerophosphocholine phosphodiesterase Gde1 n=1 Tax=Rhizophagus clarus TaxID=94130 RepID=A0A2Z6S7B9_9GLOM|nr:hypothetical protein RclHR1_03740003 [Rhizophagus clarus]GES82849.1 glycerophosphocholine phosphodiesterase Gde1 [Rhizophagus clarus]
MKFGKTLLRNQIPEWSRNYISYKALKKLIKNAVKADETTADDFTIAFFYEVDRELEKVDNFFLYKYSEMERRLRTLSEKYRCFHVSAPNSPSINFNSFDNGINVPGTSAYIDSNLDPYADKEFLAVIRETKDQIHKIIHFADINKKGFVKILKKFEKKLGRQVKDRYLETKVNILPFSSSSLFTEMLDSIERWIQEVHHRVTDYEQNVQQDNEFTTKARLRRINLTKEQDRILSNSIADDDAEALKDLINQLSSDLNNKRDPNISSIQTLPIKKTLTSMLYKACNFRAMKCIKLLLNSGASIHDDENINERSLIHKLVIYGGELPKDESSPSATPHNSSMNSNFISLEGSQITYFATAFQTQKDSKNIRFNTNNDSEDISLLSWILENIPQTEYSKVSFKDAFGRKPLHYAAVKGFEKSTKILLEFLIRTGQYSLQQGFNDPSWFDNDGFTPLLYAVLCGHTSVVNCIIKVGNIKNVDTMSYVDDLSPATTVNPALPYSISRSHTQTPLAIACKFGHTITAKLLLAYGADPDIQDEEGETPLHLATRNGFDDCVKLLVGLDDHTEEHADDIKIILESRRSNLKKANTEIKEKFYGWTPLFLAAVEGHIACVKVLIQAGANPDVKDNSGWTPHIHAVFRGYNAVKEFLRPLTAFVEPRPLFSTITNTETSSDNSKSFNKPEGASAELAYGHKYLQDQSLIIVTLGNTDMRENVNPVDLYNTKIPSTSIPLNSVSLIVSAENATGEPAIIDLPINNKFSIDPIMFYTDDIKKVILTFDIAPTYGTYEAKKQFIGRATALISSVKTSSGPHSSLMGSVTVPILSKDSLDVIGRVVFEFLVINPFKHEKLAVGSKHTYWTSTKVIGHRGFGMNRAETPNLQIGENTLISFITAASLGAEYVEFDIQLTKDHVPVIYHDWTITETGYDIPIHAITLHQFLEINKRRFVPEKFLVREHDIRKEFLRPTTNDEKKEGKLKGNSDGTIQGPFVTLIETFKHVPIHIGFNIEVKYPMIDEAEADGLPAYYTELNLFVDTILQCVYDHAQEKRNVIFSSFHPDICLMLAFKQPNYPVFFLTDCGEETMADGRCNSLQMAIRFAKFANLLGIVAKSVSIIEAPILVKAVKETGLLLFTYGSMNNNVDNARLQRKAGVDAVIVDSVLAVRKGLQQND